MAKASSKFNIVKKLVEVKELQSIFLELTPHEASILRVVCSKIGGHPNTTFRGIIDSIGNALDNEGIHLDSNLRSSCIDSSKGTIYFK